MTGPIDRSALMQTYAEPPVTFVRGEGSALFDASGKRYLDFLSGLAVTSLGHAHPVVADAIGRQARTLSHVSNLFGNDLAPAVAATLDRLIGGGTERRGRPGVLRQLGSGGQRVCDQTGTPVGGARSFRGGEHLGRISRPDDGDPRGDRTDRQAATVPADA